MDLAHILTQAGEIMAGGAGVYMATFLAKKANSIPWVTPENVASVRACAAVLSLVAVVISKAADGSLDTVTVQNLMQAVLAFLGTWALAHTIHASVKASDNNQPPV
jgi:NAD(P)H-dependent FMN reductase